MPSRPDRNKEYVARSHVKAWLLKNARTSAIGQLIDGLEAGGGSTMDLQMLNEVRTLLAGPKAPPAPSTLLPPRGSGTGPRRHRRRPLD